MFTDGQFHNVFPIDHRFEASYPNLCLAIEILENAPGRAVHPAQIHLLRVTKQCYPKLQRYYGGGHNHIESMMRHSYTTLRLLAPDIWFACVAGVSSVALLPYNTHVVNCEAIATYALNGPGIWGVWDGRVWYVPDGERELRAVLRQFEMIWRPRWERR